MISDAHIIESETTLHDGMPENHSLREWLGEYYGTRVQKTEDLLTKACCTEDTNRRFVDILRVLPDEVVSKQYGCGSPIPSDDLTGIIALDLGCGAGTDVFLLANLVGPTGYVHGVDMTTEQLDTARRNTPAVMESFGYRETNTAFHEGYIETIDAIEDSSVDLVVSNCVINLSPAKEQVFRAIRRVLKPGGEVCFSDVVADRRVPPEIADDPVMVAECLGGALYEHDLFDIMDDAGFRDARVVSRRLIERDRGGVPIEFWSLTIRAFAYGNALDRRCEDYGQVAVYRGSIAGHEARYEFDDHHSFERNRPTLVCRNTARMISETRLSRHFDVSDPREHFGLFDCAPASATNSDATTGACC
jgi:arsenite methyltransferase